MHLESKYLTFVSSAVRDKLFGSEALGVFSPTDTMPVNHEQYYGFTKFAIELNELDSSLKLLLPPTDTRLRVDQR